MLARQLDGVAVLVCSNRHLAGRLAEHHFGCTVHVLDDGFQHFTLRRDADVVVIARDDVTGARPLPSGRLREPLDVLDAADAIVMLGDAELPGVRQPTWRARRVLQAVRPADPAGQPLAPEAGPVVAVAGIADPDRFFADLRTAGWTIAREMRFRDHHRYTGRDASAMVETARQSRAQAVLTTEKDLVRLLPFRPFQIPLGFAPLALQIDAAETFDEWLRERVDAARGRS
jgi:tetraacyldisaccharide 4'-kinase